MASDGDQCELHPGDSVIAIQGQAQLAARCLPHSHDVSACPQLQAVFQQQHQQTQQQQQLVTLRLLLPEELLMKGAHDNDQNTITEHNEMHATTSKQHDSAAIRQSGSSAGPKHSLHASSSPANDVVTQEMAQRMLGFADMGAWLLSHDEGRGLQVPDNGSKITNTATPNESSRHSESSNMLAADNTSQNTASGSHITQLSRPDMGGESTSNTAAGTSKSIRKPKHQQRQRMSGAGSDVSSSSATSSSSNAAEAALGDHQVLKRALCDAGAFKLPNQTNRLALLFGPHDAPGLSLSFGIEIFEPGHETPPHIHTQAHELFFVLAGQAQGFANGRRFDMEAGGVVVFPPGVEHGIDNKSDKRLYCLQVRAH
eukprot:jgi/Chrzof1/5382/Cz16g00230.t1